MHDGPRLTCDVIIRSQDDPEWIVLVRRRYPPPGWALPGGFVERGESAETAAVREAREETGLEVKGLRQFHTYSEPDRDPRGHAVSVVFTGHAQGKPVGGDDAAEARLFHLQQLPGEMAFDHRAILDDYRKKRTG